MRSPTAVVALAGLAFAGPVLAQVPATRIAVSGTPAPLIPPDVGNFEGVAVQPLLNNAGEIAFDTGLFRPNAEPIVQFLLNQASFRTRLGQPITPIAICNEPIPGQPPNVVYAPLIRFGGISDSGRVSFSSLTAIVPDPITIQTLTFILGIDDGAGVTVVARQGDQVPGEPTGVLLGAPGSTVVSPSPNRQGASGSVAFFVPLLGSVSAGDNEAVIYRPPSGPLRVALREGRQVPGEPSGVVFGPLDEPTLDPDDRIVVNSSLVGAPGNPAAVVAVRPTGAVTIVARGGQTPPGVSGVGYTAFDRPGVAQGGRTLFASKLTDGSDALVLDVGGVSQVVARSGDPVPGVPGATILDLGFGQAPFPPRGASDPSINASGQVVFLATIQGPGVFPINNNVILAGTPGNLRLVARAGNPAPGHAAGSTLGALSNFAINAAGQVAFTLIVNTPAGERSTVYVAQPTGELVLVARAGQTLEFLPGVTKTLLNVGANLSQGRQGGFDSSFNDAGVLLINPEFLDESTGLYLTRVAVPCYANCDGSTSAPVLNALDFACFLSRYQQASALPAGQQVASYPNCDGSTAAPVLNALDFSCFLQRFQAGCN